MNPVFSLLRAFVTAGALSASAQSDWHDPFPAHRIADHLYYVGSKGLRATSSPPPAATF